MEKKKLFNPYGNDKDAKLILSDITNILNISNVKYPQFLEFYFRMFSNNWLPHEKSDMSGDYECYHTALTDDEKEVLNNILSFLVYMDSIQTNNLPNINDFITLPEIVLVLTRQAFDESIHSYSYSYIGEKVMLLEEYNRMIYLWKENKLLLERDKYIANEYDKYKDKKDPTSFLILAIANYELESLYFYNGFQFFHTLANRGLMMGTQVQIKYIQRDELVHVDVFAEILKIFREEFNKYWDEDLIYNHFSKAVEYEMKFNQEIIGDKVLGITSSSIEDYTYYLANERLTRIGLKPIFPDRKNPYKHLEKIASIEEEDTNMVNQFETRSTNYKNPAVFKGWDKVDEALDKIKKRVCLGRV